MKILCPQCFKQIEDIKKNIATCYCGFEYNIKNKPSLYRLRLDGGYIKEGVNYNEVIKGIQDGSLLPNEYIAAQDGPWITIYDSPFAKYIIKNSNKTYKRRAVPLYKERKRLKIFVIIISTLLIFSVSVNIVLSILMGRMKVRIEELVTIVTGG